MRIFTMTKKSNSDIISIFAVKSYADGTKEKGDFSSLNGRLVQISSWNADGTPGGISEFVADVYFKWDCCTHWHFYGEDYNMDNESSNSYYHLCGHTFPQFVDMMAFVSTVLEDNFLTHESSIEDLATFKLLKVKERYKIEEVEGRPDWFDLIYGHEFSDTDL